MAKVRVVTLIVAPEIKRTAAVGGTFKDRVGMSTRPTVKSDTLYWPNAAAVFVRGEAGKKLRSEAYGVALSKVNILLDLLAGHVAAGNEINVQVKTGAILTADPSVARYSNVVAQVSLREVCEMASSVHVAAGAEDPRDYEGEEEEEEG